MAALVADVSPIFKLHLVLGMTIFLVFPFTRLVHVWCAPVWYLGRRGYQIVRTREQTRRGGWYWDRKGSRQSAPAGFIPRRRSEPVACSAHTLKTLPKPLR